jgi:DNA invertase Pin-like site-specific DNA recombinase
MMPRRIGRTGNPQLAIAYLRVSTAEQRVDQQRDAIERWAGAHGVRVVAWCSDEGISGAAVLDERPALLEALALLRTHGAGFLVAAKRDRLARDVGSAAAIERLSAEAGSRVVTADGLDSADTPEGQLVRTMVDAIAQYERALIRTRTRVALQAKKKRGEVVGQPQFGQRAVGGRLEQDPGEQLALDRMRHLRAAGLPHGAIATKLQQEGYKPRGVRWHTTTVTRALSKL